MANLRGTPRTKTKVGNHLTHLRTSRIHSGKAVRNNKTMLVNPNSDLSLVPAGTVAVWDTCRRTAPT